MQNVEEVRPQRVYVPACAQAPQPPLHVSEGKVVTSARTLLAGRPTASVYLCSVGTHDVVRVRVRLLVLV